MTIVKVAKVLSDSTSLSSIPNDSWILTRESGSNKGIRLSYKSGDNNIRVLSPLEEFDRYYKYSDDTGDSNPLVNNVENANGTIRVEAGHNSIVIMDIKDYHNSLNGSQAKIVLPAIDTNSINNGIYYSQNVRVVIDRNILGFSIETASADNKFRTIEGDVTSITITKAFTTFEIFSAPDGKWRIIGNYLDNTADILAIAGNYTSVDEVPALTN